MVDQAMEARLRRVEELVGKPEQPPTMGLIQQVLAVEEEVENLKRKVKKELLQFVEKGLVSMSEDDWLSSKRCGHQVGGLENGYKAARVSDTEKVSIKSMYLHRDARMWWCSCLSNDTSTNRERIETWEVMKKVLKDQFIPCNKSWVAREFLHNLSHTRTVREFVKEFSSFMLDVRDMSRRTSYLTLWQV
ncbi:UNVERIFIED_CONTAM: hypothetical protein Sradi_6438700 [Sesamum radiatum]|uniref:Retrotransposon gag domain-containing protein n=1 Tax=Sesamum radiatum TaxID=300843 RepID=A0AAW2K412_SESRA